MVDLFGRVNMAKACVASVPPRPYLGLFRSEAHVLAAANGIDEYIMREMGREGPPPSKFYVAEVKELVQKMFPPIEEDVGEDDEEDDDDDGEDEED